MKNSMKLSLLLTVGLGLHLDNIARADGSEGNIIKGANGEWGGWDITARAFSGADSSRLEGDGALVHYVGHNSISRCVVFGPYFPFGQDGEISHVEAFLDMEFLIYPDTYRTCSHVNWRDKCVGWDTHEVEDYAFTIELAAAGGTVILGSKEFRGVRSTHRHDIFISDGPIYLTRRYNDVEMRICDLSGGDFDIKLYGAKIKRIQ